VDRTPRRLASIEGYRDGDATLVITEQTGRTFKGAVQWSTPGGTQEDDLRPAGEQP
jgi:hypothetical protein